MVKIKAEVGGEKAVSDRLARHAQEIRKKEGETLASKEPSACASKEKHFPEYLVGEKDGVR